MKTGWGPNDLSTEMGVRTFGADFQKFLSPVDNRGGNYWWPGYVREPYSGAWQKNDEWRVQDVTAYPTVYACITMISNDIGKMPHKLVRNVDGIWETYTSPAFSPVLQKPNRYQNHIQFKEWWVMSKLLKGNTYVLKERDNRNIVTGLYILDPCRVQVLVAENGDVFYQLGQDPLADVEQEQITVPASEIIHDRMNCLFHPLVGISPLYAAAIVAGIGLKIQNNTLGFFGNSSNPGGVLTAPGAISDATAQRLKEHWETNYTGGRNAGKIAVLGDGLKFEAMRMSAVDSQMVELLKWSDEKICSVFHMPAYKVGVGAMPTFNNIETLNQEYLNQCLQSLIEQYELVMDEGLGLNTVTEGVELDTEVLVRMDTASKVDTLNKEVSGSIKTINEARKEMNLRGVDGGDSIWMQQQDTSLEALAERDRENPLGVVAAPAEPEPVAEPVESDEEQVARFFAALEKHLEAA